MTFQKNPPVPDYRPRHGVVNIDRTQFNGFFSNRAAIFVVSGSVSELSGTTTGSIPLHFDAFGLKLKRAEIFHSGAASFYDISIESSPSGSIFDPRNIVVEYPKIVGSDDFACGGIDQTEDLYVITDLSGNLYLNIKPYDSGLNDFKYLFFFEATLIYVDGV